MPYCNARRTVLSGVENGKQTYLRKDVKHRWKKEGALGGHSFPPEQIGTGIQKYYTGLSFRRAAKAVKEQFGLEDTDISPQTIRNWVHRYTNAAVKLTRGYKAAGGACGGAAVNPSFITSGCGGWCWTTLPATSLGATMTFP